MDFANIVSLPWVVPIVSGCAVAIMAILGGMISECLKSIAHTNLKRSMVEQGYTIEQIDHVLYDEYATGRPGKAKKRANVHG